MDQLLALFTNHPWFILIQTIGLVISAGLNTYLLFNSKQGEVQDKVSEERGKLISALDGRLKLLEQEMAETQEQLGEANNKLDLMLNENRRLETILAMRDPESAEIRTQARLAMVQINSIYDALIVTKRGKRQVGS